MDTITAIGLVRGLAGVGAIGLAVAILALVGPRVPAFMALDDGLKKFVMFALSAAIAMAAWAAVKYVPDSFWVVIQEPFAVLMVIFVGIFGNQLAYRLWPKLGKLSSQMKQIEQAGMLVPDNMITPSMTPDEVLRRLDQIRLTQPRGVLKVYNETNQPLDPPDQPSAPEA